MNGICNENLYVKPVEVCNFKALSKLNEKNQNPKYSNDSNYIFKNELKTYIDDLNYSFRNTIDNKFTYDENDLKKKNKKFLCYPTDITKKEYYLNCVLETKNPLFTFKDGLCMVHPDLNLNKERLIKGDDGFVYINNAKDEQGNFKYFRKKNTAYCEDKWFDWIITPNYHFGNRYYRDSGAYSKEDVKKCYKPCGMGRLPYLNDNNEYICVSKDVVYDGIYRNKLDYSPIALINLIGNNKHNLKKLYENLYTYKIKQIDDTYYEKNIDIINSFDINDAIDEIKKVLNIIVTDNNLNIPSYSTEKNHLTYKHPNFNENDETLLTYIGLDKNDVISNDIILIHTAYLALGYYNFYEKIMKIPDGFKDENIKDKIKVEKFNNNEFNIMRVLEGLDVISYNTNNNKNFIESIKNIFNKFNEINNEETKMSLIKINDELKDQIIAKVLEICKKYIDNLEFSEKIDDEKGDKKIKAYDDISKFLDNELTKNSEDILVIDFKYIYTKIFKIITQLISSDNEKIKVSSIEEFEKEKNKVSEYLSTIEKIEKELKKDFEKEIKDVINNYATNNLLKSLNKKGFDKLFNDKDINYYKIVNKDITIKKQQRLANILFKAINICYDNKTDFSKNIIYKTMEAIYRQQDVKILNYNDIINEFNNQGFSLNFFNYSELKKFKDNINIPDVPSFFENNFKKNYQDNFIFYTEETSELLNDKRCINGQFLQDNKCVKCNEICISAEVCKTNSDCKIYCNNDCAKFQEDIKDSRCGRKVGDKDLIKSNETVNNIKTPIDDENYIPNFSYIFKTSIKIFFALIIVFVAYIFYKLFGETILTLINMIYYPFLLFIKYIWYRRDNVKYAESNYDIIKNKYDEISRSLIKSNVLKGR